MWPALLAALTSLTTPSVAATTTLFSETFSGIATRANAWRAVGTACLTAGTTETTSVPPCKAGARSDAAGQGALQLTAAIPGQAAMAVATTPFATQSGLQIDFTDYAYSGSTPGADGLVLFLSDASKPLPAAYGSAGGSLGYANSTTTPGIANAYVGIGFDEYGNFSAPAEGRNGGPGTIAETIAVRGSAPAAFPYLGGTTNSSGKPASLPFKFDRAASRYRPSNAIAVEVTLSPGGRITVCLDRHDGTGFVQYYSQLIVGVNGQGAVPARVYVGMTASTGGFYTRQQISDFTVSTAPSTISRASSRL